MDGARLVTADQLLVFFGYPCEHWVHLAHDQPDRASLRHRTKVTKGPACGREPGHGVQAHRSRTRPLARAVNAPYLVALVRAGATFTNGKLVERPGEHTEPEAA